MRYDCSDLMHIAMGRQFASAHSANSIMPMTISSVRERTEVIIASPYSMDDAYRNKVCIASLPFTYTYLR